MLVIFVFMLPRSPRFNYEYKKGEFWQYETLYAEFDFPILKTQKQLKNETEEARNSVNPHFVQKEDVYQEVQEELAELSLEEHGLSKSMIRSILKDIYSKGVLNPHDVEAMDMHHREIYVVPSDRSEKEKVHITNLKKMIMNLKKNSLKNLQCYMTY